MQSQTTDLEQVLAKFKDLRRIQVNHFVIDVYLNDYKRGKLTIPSYQRAYIWNSKLRNELIESLLLHLPIGSVYLYYDRASHTTAILDGSQRLRTIISFCNDEFALEGLSLLPEFNGVKFSDLGWIARELENTVLPCHTLSEHIDREMYLTLFKRINNNYELMSDEDFIFGAYADHPLVKHYLTAYSNRKSAYSSLALEANSSNRYELISFLESYDKS